jgi:hypothetical protein
MHGRTVLQCSIPAVSEGLLHPSNVMRAHRIAPSFVVGLTLSGCAGVIGHAGYGSDNRFDPRARIIARAQVWRATNIRSMDIKKGPQRAGAFAPRAIVYCDFVDKKLDGNSPKFACRIGADDEVKVKYGGTNGEVYGEVLATRLLWALGFGADAMYPVNVTCRGCPRSLGGIARTGNQYRFDPAVIERKLEHAELDVEGRPGWSWAELDQIDTTSGGAPKAHRDALKLLAVLLQHTDSKPQQQRIVCLGVRGPTARSCDRPFLMISDVGLTFGGAARTNPNELAGVNLERWRRKPVWKARDGCVGNLPRSFTGTLDDPVISEEGRRFLANLLAQLSERQIRDLFEVARVNLRLRAPGHVDSGYSSVDEWVQAFKQKRIEISERRCE